MGQPGEGAEQPTEGGDPGAHARQRALPPKDLQVRKRHRAADRVPGIAVAVEEGFPLFILSQEGSIDLLGGQRGGQRKIPSGQPLADGHQIRGDPFVVTREHPSGPTEPGRDFVRNQQHVVPRAELADALQVAGRGGQHTGSGLDKRFDDEAGDLPVPPFQNVFDRFEAGQGTGRIRQPYRAPVTVRRIRGDRGKQEGVESLPEQIDAPHAHRSDGVAVIAEPEVHEGPFRTGARDALLPILNRHLERDFHGGGSIV